MPQQPIDSLPRNKHIIELSVFLFLIVPSLVYSFFVVKQGALNFTFTAIATIVRDLALVCLVLYFIWDNKEPFSALGLGARSPLREIALGALLFIPFSFAVAALDGFLSTHGLHSPRTPLPSLTVTPGIGAIVLATILVIIVAFSEEMIFRGYLMLRFRGATGNAGLAVLLSSFVFSLGHGYEGSAGVATVGVMGAVFAAVYLWRGNLIAPMAMHFLQDFTAIVLAPAMAAK